MSVVLIAVVQSSSAQARTSGFRVTAVRQGLVRYDAERKAEIYAEGDSFPYVPNSQCFDRGRMSLCLRHGFEFTYESPDEVTDLECTMASLRGPVAEVTASAAPASPGGSVSSWNTKLGARTGHYTRTRSWSVAGTADPRLRETVTCRVKGQEVFSHTFAVTPPTP